MVTSTGRQARLRNLYRNVAVTGRRDPIPPRRVKNPLPPPPTVPVAGNKTRCSSSGALFSSRGGDDTNRSFNLWRALPSLLFSGGSSSPPFSSSSSSIFRISEGAPRRGRRRRSGRLRSMRSVLRRRSWMTGLAVGLRVGLPATAHWVAKSLNFCRVAILIVRESDSVRFFRWGISGGGSELSWNLFRVEATAVACKREKARSDLMRKRPFWGVEGGRGGMVNSAFSVWSERRWLWIAFSFFFGIDKKRGEEWSGAL